jgi:uncharacterized protein YggE
VKLGALVYVSNQTSALVRPMPMMRAYGAQGAGLASSPQPLAIEPRKVTSSANVYAVYAIE